MKFERLPSGLMVPRTPEILVRKHMDAELSVGAGFAGYIGWELRRNGKVIRSSEGVFHNLLVDQGLDMMNGVSLTNLVAQAQMGTGATAPNVADVGLVAPVATAMRPAVLVVAATYVAGPPDYWYKRYTYNFTELFANGNLTEIGIFHNGGTMAIRQLLKDGTGTPTTITKTVTDQLLITFEIRCYPPTVDVASVVNISGVNYDVVTRAANVTTGGAWGETLSSPLLNSGMGCLSYETDVLGARTSHPAGTNVNTTDHTQTAYVGGTYFLETKEIHDVATANFATGIGSMLYFFGQAALFDNVPLFQSNFTPKIPKVNTKKLTIFVRRNWARYP